MSVQFGRWNLDGQPVDPCYLQKTKKMLAPYGPDGGGVYIKDGVGILCRAFHTTKESRKESQPLVTPSGSVLSWDGRLDNREELIRELGEPPTDSATDLDIVAAAYEAKGSGCFAKLIGDWALSVWEPKTRSVVLAKDPIGTRHLYYSFDKDQITWSTILDPLVLLAGKSFALEEEYIAGWLSFFPATHLTPYVGIHSVPPSCFIRLDPWRQTIKRYWDFDRFKRIRYKTDGEYEEHFRQVFGEAVRRRLRSDSPILAELSGGMDSSSIVCMADTIIARGHAETPRLDTISYYDDSEPNWNERPFVEVVEKKRGCVGCKIDVRSSGSLTALHDNGWFFATPASWRGSSNGAREFGNCLVSQGNRVLLSGIGGDENLGGIPTPIPELADLLAEGQLRTLAKQMCSWALAKRQPLLRLAAETVRAFLPHVLIATDKQKRPAPWIEPAFVKRHRRAISGYPTPVTIHGSLPGFRESRDTLNTLLRQLSTSTVSASPLYEQRYPFLDRHLLEFLFAIPREQLIRPQQRRSLMRRALVGILPDEILHRRRKAFVARNLIMAMATLWPLLSENKQQLLSDSLGIINSHAFVLALQNAYTRQTLSSLSFVRAIILERWLGHLHRHVPSAIYHPQYSRYFASDTGPQQLPTVTNGYLPGGCQ